MLYILELTFGFESNLEVNSTRKSAKYLPVIQALQATYREVKFINVSMSDLGAMDKSCDSQLALLNDLDTPYNLGNRLISKIISISIRCTYYIFCRRNKDWTDPVLMDLSTILLLN